MVILILPVALSYDYDDTMVSGAGVETLLGNAGPKEESQVTYEDVPNEEQEPDRIRSLFPEAWLWDILSIGWVG